MAKLISITQYLRSTRVRFLIVLATLLGLLTMMSASFAVSVTQFTPTWSNVVGSSGAPTCVTTDNVSGTVTVFYGDDDANLGNGCPPTSSQSGLGFTSSTNRDVHQRFALPARTTDPLQSSSVCLQPADRRYP